jgi:hypothetical protein
MNSTRFVGCATSQLPIRDATEAVRKLGNIGAHMEKDINVTVDVDPNEASLLTGLVETPKRVVCRPRRATE